MKELKIGETFVLNDKVYKCEKENDDKNISHSICYGCAFDNDVPNCITKTLYPCGNHNRKDEQGVRYVEVELNPKDIKVGDLIYIVDTRCKSPALRNVFINNCFKVIYVSCTSLTIHVPSKPLGQNRWSISFNEDKFYKIDNTPSNDIEPLDSTKEYNIGDKFIFNDSIIQVFPYKEYRNVSKGVCDDCVFNINNGNCLRKIPYCFSATRKDKTSIIYLKEDFCKSKGITNNKNDMKIENNKLEVPEGYKAVAINDDGTVQLELIHKEKSWEEFGKIEGWFVSDEGRIFSCKGSTYEYNKNVYPTKELAEASLALCQLLQWRDKVNAGWTPNWEDNELKYIVDVIRNIVGITYTERINKILVFRTNESAEQFLKDHKSLIEIAKPLL